MIMEIKHLCKLRIILLRIEGFWAKQRRKVETKIVLQHVRNL
tara:strand:- start:105 stop:230 length:126 start_codon:yes stop_codon:yes gene_type:complete